jgi:hypothetical protein
MGPLKRTVTGVPGSTLVAPPVGVTDWRTVSPLGLVVPFVVLSLLHAAAAAITASDTIWCAWVDSSRIQAGCDDAGRDQSVDVGERRRPRRRVPLPPQ